MKLVEFAEALALEVREALTDQARAHTEAVDAVRAELDASGENQRAEVEALKEVIDSIPAGPPGEPGARGEKGEPGDAGPVGEKGMDGRDGRDGKDGRDGVATRDELNELVKEAVESRVADVVRKAVADAVAELPKYEYRSVWKAGEAYERGNWTTYGGSLWHCNKSGTGEKPGSGEDWTLAVKRGRDGREPVEA